MRLANTRHWVFDMDGTLTWAVHDFLAVHRALDILEQDDTLLYLAVLPEVEVAVKHAWLLEHECALTEAARSAPGALELMRESQWRGVRLGVLTRDDHQLVLVTLEAVGLGGCLPTECILGRGETRSKPDPDGLLRITRRRDVTPAESVMVGDYCSDLDCERAAGSRTVLVNLPEDPWPELADWHAADCHALLEQLQTPQEYPAENFESGSASGSPKTKEA